MDLIGCVKMTVGLAANAWGVVLLGMVIFACLQICVLLKIMASMDTAARVSCNIFDN